MSLSAYNPSRRRFLVTGATLAGALVVGFGSSRFADRLGDPAIVPVDNGEIALNAWLKIGMDGIVTVMLPRAEMGQAVHTALPMLVAEELGVAWAQVRVQAAGVDRVYANVAVVEDGLPLDHRDQSPLVRLTRAGLGMAAQVLQIQVTGGSTSVRDAWLPMREAGAAARQMLTEAAAERWNLLPEQLSVEDGFVVFKPEQRKASFGTLAAAASRLSPPSRIKLRPAGTHTVIGTSPTRIDTPAKSRGEAGFGIDARPDGLLYAAIRHAPRFDAESYQVDSAAARAAPGVLDVVRLDGAVAVVAKHYWQALSASRSIQFAYAEASDLNDDEVARQLREGLSHGYANCYERRGDPDAAERGQSVISATFAVPYLAHACLEPQNCTARVGKASAELWLGHQAPSFVVGAVASRLGIAPDDVVLHQEYLGGGFGRRSEVDVVLQAVAVARQFPDTPVQLIWSREEDMQHDFYRPAAMASMRAVVDDDGRLVSLRQRLACTSVSRAFVGRLTGKPGPEMPENTNADGAKHVAYDIPNVLVEHAPVDLPVPVGFWRSVGYSQNSFFYEAFLDEVASQSEQDPLALRESMLTDRPRHQAVMARLREVSGWRGARPTAGVGRGVAMVESFGSIVALVVDVEAPTPDRIRLRHVHCVVDCGVAVHPGQVQAQMEGGILYGLGAALFSRVNVMDGRVSQQQFSDYPMLRMGQTPPVDVHILEGSDTPGGAGEPGTPPAAPALVNAVFAATGKRFRTLPVIGRELTLV